MIQYPIKRPVIHKISQSLKATTFVFRTVQSFWNLTDVSAAILPRRLSHFKAIHWFKLPISRVRDFTRSYVNPCYRILKRYFVCCLYISYCWYISALCTSQSRGFLNKFHSLSIISVFQSYENNVYIIDLVLIFDLCRRNPSRHTTQ